MKKIVISAMVVGLLAGSVLYAAAKKISISGDPALGAMRAELERSMSKLKVEDFGAPYFILYTLVEWESQVLSSRYGALYYEGKNRKNSLDAEVRVGTYESDSSVHNFQDAYSPTDYLLSEGQASDAPVDYDPAAIRHGLWLLTDSAYKSAVARLQNKKIKRAVGAPDQNTLADFTREKPLVLSTLVAELAFDREDWIELLNEESAYLGKIDLLLESGISLQLTRYLQRQINSEGSAAIEGGTYYELTASVEGLADDGTPLFDIVQFKGRTLSRMPPQAEIHAGLEALVKRFGVIMKAEEMAPYTGPAILSAEVAGVLFHEAIGHRLEDIRQRSENEGQTFKDKVGKPILPEFLTVVDDPTAAEFNRVELFGHFTVDDQLVAAQRVVLVENGILRNFLLGRRPIEGFDHSNGHARGGGALGPIGRMSSLFVQSSREKSREELKKMLIEESKRQGKQYGIIIERVLGGETNTKRQGFFGEGQAQVFRVPVILAYKVDVATGEELAIRGIDLIGTPLVSISKIVATGNDYHAEDGYCGAESGTQPVAQIAPSILTTEVELQRSATQKRSKPFLPRP